MATTVSSSNALIYSLQSSSISRVRVFRFSLSNASPYMAMKRLYNETKGLKLKDLPDHNKSMLFVDFAKKNLQKGFDNYHIKYIQTSSVDPLIHVWFGGTIFSYLVPLLEEHCHIKHAKEHGHCPRS